MTSWLGETYLSTHDPFFFLSFIYLTNILKLCCLIVSMGGPTVSSQLITLITALLPPSCCAWGAPQFRAFIDFTPSDELSFFSFPVYFTKSSFFVVLFFPSKIK